jgi:putative spermidine/putrescine transport system substrate-binding protein
MMRALLSTAAALALTAGVVQAEEKTVYLAAYGGSTETLFKDVIIPKWQEKTGAKVVYVSGNSTDTLAKLRAQEGAQEIDIAFIDDGPMTQAINFGYCDTVDPATFDGLYDAARMPDNKAVGIGIVATGLAYNKDLFAEKGWAAPTSWADLADPKYKGMIAIPPITNGYGLHALIMAAKLNGGGESNIEPGFQMFEDKIGDNVLVYEPSSGKMSELFQNGEIALSVWGSGRLKSLADTGFPGAFAYPDEGAVNLLIAACSVVDSDVPELAQDFLKFMVSPEMQRYFAVEKGWGPVHKDTELSDEEIGALPVGPGRVDKLVNIDYTTVNKERGAWTQQWTRRIEN